MRGGRREGAGRPPNVVETMPRRRSVPVKREEVTDFFEDAREFSRKEVLPAMKEMFLTTQDKRLRADIAKWFCAYGFGSPIQRTSAEVESVTAESTLFALFKDLPREDEARPRIEAPLNGGTYRNPDDEPPKAS